MTWLEKFLSRWLARRIVRHDGWHLKTIPEHLSILLDEMEIRFNEDTRHSLQHFLAEQCLTTQSKNQTR